MIPAVEGLCQVCHTNKCDCATVLEMSLEDPAATLSGSSSTPTCTTPFTTAPANASLDSPNYTGYAHVTDCYPEELERKLYFLFKKLHIEGHGEIVHFKDGAVRRVLKITKQHFFDLAVLTFKEQRAAAPDRARWEKANGRSPYNVLDLIVWKDELSEIEVDAVARHIALLAVQMRAPTLTEYEAGRGASNKNPGQWHTDTRPDKPEDTMIAAVGVLRKFDPQTGLVSTATMRGSTRFIQLPLGSDGAAAAEGTKEHCDLIRSTFKEIKRDYSANLTEYGCELRSDFKETLSSKLLVQDFPNSPRAVTFFKTSTPHSAPQSSPDIVTFFAAAPVYAGT